MNQVQLCEEKVKRVARRRQQLKTKLVALRAALKNKNNSMPGRSREEKAEALNNTKETTKQRQARIRAWRIGKGEKLRKLKGDVVAPPSGACAAALD